MAELETASWGRRLSALVVDWFASILVVMTVLGPVGWSSNRYAGLYTTAVFLAESAVLTSLAGGSFGKLMTRLRVVRVGATGPVDLLRSVLRAALVCLVVPPLVFRADGRGLHDLAAGTATVPLTVLRG